MGGSASIHHLFCPAPGESWKFCLSGDSRFLPLVIDGDKKVAFPGDSRWCSDNKAIFCNMVASACPKERFVVGPVPVWLGASEDGRAIPECWLSRRRVGAWGAPAAMLSNREGICCCEAVLCPALLEMEGTQHPPPWPGTAHCMWMVLTCRGNVIACLIHGPLLAAPQKQRRERSASLLRKISLPDPSDD